MFCLHDDVGFWWLGCNASFLFTFGWQKGAAADASFRWRKNAVSMLAWMVKNCNVKCKLMFIFIFSVCHLMKPWWYWHSFFCRMWVSRVGVVGMYVRHQAFTPFAVLLKSIDHLCQMLFRRMCHSDEAADEHWPSMSNAF